MLKRLFIFFIIPLLSVITLSPPAFSDFTSQRGNVYVMENDPAGNQVIAYSRSPSGRLRLMGRFATGGLGAGDNAGADPLGSQGSVILSPNRRNLYVVNAGSDEISVFTLRTSGRPILTQIIPSNGDFPVSLAISGRVLYVLNSGSDGSISGFRITGSGLLDPIADSTRTLGLGADSFPAGDARNLAPGDIGFDTLNRRLLITFAGGGETGQLLSFELNDDDTPAPVAQAISSQGAVPFSLAFSSNGTALIAEASGSISSYNYNESNQLIPVSSVVANAQMATCWVGVTRNEQVFTANTVSGTISQYAVSRNGEVTLVNALAASGIGLPVDFDFTRNGRLMYVVTSSEGGVRGFSVNPRTGLLSDLGLFPGLPTFENDGFAPQGIAVR